MSDDFLSRWSRRKRAARRTDPRQPPEAPPNPFDAPESPQDQVPPEDSGIVGAPEAELNEEETARLPSLDELTADSDISMFMRKGVPERLRNAALRRMWALDPKIRDYVSEAREYAYDWNTPGGVPGFGGPLPPPEEIERMAARIVGAFIPDTVPPVEAAAQGSSDTPSQNGDDPAGASTEQTSAAVCAQADAAVTPESPQTAKPLAGLSSQTRERSERGADDAHEESGSRQSQREQPQKTPRASRHGGAMPV